MDTASSETSLLTFPTEFPIKIMGMNVPEFTLLITSLLREHKPDFNPSSFEVRESSAQKYLSLTCTLWITSQQQLDAIYMTLSSHPDVLMVL